MAVKGLSGVPLRSRAKQNNKLHAETYSDYQVAEHLQIRHCKPSYLQYILSSRFESKVEIGR